MALGKKGVKVIKKKAKQKRPRRPWTEVQKRAIVAQAQQPGVTKKSVAGEHEITEALLYKWTQQYGSSAASSSPPTSDKRVVELAIAQLDAEIDRLTREREELRKSLK